MIGCGIKGCREKPTHARRGLAVHLPGHPLPVELGDVKLCAKHELATRTGGVKTTIRDDLIASALARQ